jgi:hypothetical protein
MVESPGLAIRLRKLILEKLVAWIDRNRLWPVLISRSDV